MTTVVLADDGRFQDLSALLAAAPDAMLIADDAGLIVDLNGRCARLLGYEPEELLGQPVEVLVPVAMRDVHKRKRTRMGARHFAREMGSGAELVAVRRDGTEIPVDISLAPFLTDRGPLVLAALRDVSRSRHDERLFRSLIDAAPDAVVMIDDQARITLVNARTLAILGYERGELVGEPVTLLMPARLVETYASDLARYLADPPPGPVSSLSGDLFALRKDGSEVPIELSLMPMETDDGRHFLAFVRDISERIEILAEIREAKARQQVQEATNRAKDAFMATVSHELRTPLASIIGFCELIADLDGLSAEAEHFLSVLMRNARREARLVDDLLTVVSIDEGGLTVYPAPVDLTALVAEAVESALTRAAETGVEISFDQAADVAMVDCDRDRIGQALDCLLSNAIKFTPAGGLVRVGVAADATTATIEVADSGIGIGDPDPDRVFERLYRSPRAIEQEIPGTGLGLSIAAAIVAAHDGAIRVSSTGDTGTTFEIQLPVKSGATREIRRA